MKRIFHWEHSMLVKPTGAARTQPHAHRPWEGTGHGAGGISRFLPTAVPLCPSVPPQHTPRAARWHSNGCFPYTSVIRDARVNASMSHRVVHEHLLPAPSSPLSLTAHLMQRPSSSAPGWGLLRSPAGRQQTQRPRRPQHRLP